MPRIVIKRKDSNLVEASVSCPVMAFKKSEDGEYVIDPNVCIDCGVCQTIVEEGVILEDTDANTEDINYNEEKAQEWK